MSALPSQAKTLSYKFVRLVGTACEACEGSGSEYPKRKDGRPDGRYRYPIGPCPACKGTGGWREVPA